MKQAPAKTTTRRFSKWVLVVNLVLVWGLMFMSVSYSESQWVVPSGLALIGLMFGVYTGVGHLDFRKVVELSAERLFQSETTVTSTNITTASVETEGETG